MIKFLPYLLFFTSTVVLAQLPKSLVEPSERVTMFDDYNGSIFTSSSFKDASVIHEKSGTFDTKLRYNIYLDILEYKSQDELYHVTKSPTVHARIDGDYFYYCDFVNQRGLERKGYYVLVQMNENYSIYKKFTLKITEPESASRIMTSTPEPGRLKTIRTYYLEENGVIMELSLDKSEILATLEDHGDALKKYMKSEKIKLKKEEDLIQLVAKYNALKNSEDSSNRSLIVNKSN
ncbi:hypothetical protein ACFSTE_07950 [Aquimarina hainanensis]|uniref:DUF4468 domain-containing protein n=1 Tax=Aquimarina hainanensis TaxID=1578017 RepID=A0ABW5N731_9FLAO